MKPVGSVIIPLGRQMFHAFCGVTQVGIISNETDPEILEHWLWLEGLSGYAAILPPDAIMSVQLSKADYRVWQVNQLHKKGYVIECVLEPEPDIASALLSAGYNVSLFLHAAYSVPSWRPDADNAVKPWDTLADEVANMAAMRAYDKKLIDE
jgi:hypothetical protein